MKTLYLTLIFSFSFILSKAGFSKNSFDEMSTTISSGECDSTKWAKEGTYEILEVEGSTERSELTKPTTLLTPETLCTIESSRKEQEFVNLQISPYTIIRIFPRVKTIKNGGK